MSSEISSSSSPVVLGSTMSASAAVGVIEWLTTQRKSSERSASMVFRVSG